MKRVFITQMGIVLSRRSLTGTGGSLTSNWSTGPFLILAACRVLLPFSLVSRMTKS